MMQDSPHREIVQRQPVARAATAAGFRRIGRFAGRAAASATPRASACCRRCWAVAHASADQISVVHSTGLPASSSAARAVTCIAVPSGSKPNSSSRRHSTRMHWSGTCTRDHRRIHRHVVGTVVAVAAGAVRVPHDDTLRRQPEHVGQRGAQRIRTLRVRPYRQHVHYDIPPAHRTAPSPRARHRGGNMSPPPRSSADRPWEGRHQHASFGRLADQPGRFLLIRREPPHVVPRRMRGAAAAARCTTVSSTPTNATKLPTRTTRKPPPAARRTGASSNAASTRRDWAGAGCARAACPGAPCRG